MARPEKEINWEYVHKLIEAGCRGVEISAKLRMQSDTFYYRFKKQYGKSFQDYHVDIAEGGKGDIRAMLHTKAMNNSAPGNVTLLMFLARCRLGMKEPESSSLIAPLQDTINLQHENMMLKYENEKLKEAVLNSANES
jgi:hypothetical protein